MDKRVIIFDNVSVKLPIGSNDSPFPELALDNVSFSVSSGEFAGFYFDDGIRKKKFFQIMSGKIKTNFGKVLVSDNIRIISRESIRCLPSGFKVEDCIYFYGSMIGVRKKTIKEKFSEITEFSGLNTCLKQNIEMLPAIYKSRLIFTVSCFLPDKILVFDELLSAKDGIFLERALSKLKEMNSKGVATLVVSCAPWVLKYLDKKCFSIENGKLCQGNKKQFKDLALSAID